MSGIDCQKQYRLSNSNSIDDQSKSIDSDQCGQMQNTGSSQSIKVELQNTHKHRLNDQSKVSSSQCTFREEAQYKEESENQEEEEQYEVQQIPAVTMELIKKLDSYPQQQITLEDSIPLLYEINIFQELTSIPEAKRRLSEEVTPNHRLQLEARFIYHLWKLFNEETIPFDSFREVIVLFMTNGIEDLMEKLKEGFEVVSEHESGNGSAVENDITELMGIWEGMIEDALSNRTNRTMDDQKQIRNTSKAQSNGPQYYASSFDCSQQSKEKLHPSKKTSYGNGAASVHNGGQFSNKRFDRHRNQQQRQSNIKHRHHAGSKDMYHQRSHQSYMSSSRRQHESQQSYNRENEQEEGCNVNYFDCYQIPVMTVEKEKQLIDRLYRVNRYEHFEELKRIQDAERLEKELQECTFKPNVSSRTARNGKGSTVNRQYIGSSNSNLSKPSKKAIPGYEKAIQRMKQGQEKKKELKQQLQLRNIVIKKPTEEKQIKPIPPKFLSRGANKTEQKVLFTIQFDIGRHKLTTKIHEGDSAQKLARNIQCIYSLKEESYEQIRGIIDQEIERYFALQEEEEQNDFELTDKQQPEAKVDEQSEQVYENYQGRELSNLSHYQNQKLMHSEHTVEKQRMGHPQAKFSSNKYHCDLTQDGLLSQYVS